MKLILKNKYQEKEILREKEALAKGAQIDNIILSYPIEEDDEFYYVAYEPCEISLKFLMEPYDDIKEKVSKLKPLIDITDILYNAAKGMTELHKKGFSHRNIRPANILISKRDNGNYVGKLSNFFLSKRLSPNELKQSVTDNTFYGDVIIFAIYDTEKLLMISFSRDIQHPSSMSST